MVFAAQIVPVPHVRTPHHSCLPALVCLPLWLETFWLRNLWLSPDVGLSLSIVRSLRLCRISQSRRSRGNAAASVEAYPLGAGTLAAAWCCESNTAHKGTSSRSSFIVNTHPLELRIRYFQYYTDAGGEARRTLAKKTSPEAGISGIKGSASQDIHDSSSLDTVASIVAFYILAIDRSLSPSPQRWISLYPSLL